MDEFHQMKNDPVIRLQSLFLGKRRLALEDETETCVAKQAGLEGGVENCLQPGVASSQGQVTC